MMSSKLMLRATVATLALLAGGSAFAADLPSRAAAPAPVEEHCKVAISTPSYGPTIKAPANPACFTTFLGDIYVGGAVTGYAYEFSRAQPFSAFPLPSDRTDRVDFTNLQAWVQKADGPFQFYVQAGLYSIPTLGIPNYSSFDQTDLLFTPLPVAFGKYQINDEFSVQGGRMFTNIGSELPFTFQNLNITRGLLFAQENIINHGVQLNYSSGPWNASVAVTDGFFSEDFNWFTGLVTYKIDDNNTVGVNGGFNFDKTNAGARSLRYQFATPLFQQNSGIFNVNYTYTNGPVTVTPYFQFTNVEADPTIGIFGSASTYGGAVLAAYSFTDNFALAGRVEYETQTGNRLNPGTTPGLLFGPGSSAFSFTITPTFTFDRFFIRGEYAHVQLYDIQTTALGALVGSGFGRSGNRRDQDRYMIETGFTF